MVKKARSLAGFDDVAGDQSNDSKDDSNINSNINSDNDSENDSEGNGTNKIDNLLQQRKTSEKKHYIGFYATDEIKSFLDQVPSGNKSAIINEALKMIIQNKK